MRIEWDVPIEVDDGLVLRADVFRPDGPGKFPVILSYGPYGQVDTCSRMPRTSRR